ncbi:MAG: helix-turn-helix transcriptional regulator [Candidatus Izimaplasma sp.]|nr:helix-turn-helix transcriptional regulator [Candidatus Izimaplasma bacterium]
MNIGKNLREIRLYKGYKQKDIAQELNISIPSYSRYESQKRTPTIKTIHQLSKFYSLPMQTFFLPYDGPESLSKIGAKFDKTILELKSFDKKLSKKKQTSENPKFFHQTLEYKELLQKRRNITRKLVKIRREIEDYIRQFENR